jgi:signal transduction histidine kinase
VEDFRRRTAINIHFVSEAERVNLRPRVCQELISILREALVNVRKHSGANTVVVRLSFEKDIWRLQVDDDGRGFDFTGDMSLDDLDRERRGPVVIKERVRVIGGELRIQSIPGKGSQVEVTVRPTA